MVRCGACRGIFDARLNLIEGSLGDDEDDADTFGSPQTIMAGMPATPQPSEEEIREAARAAISPKRASVDKPAAPKSTARDGGSSAAPIAAEGNADYDWRRPSRPLSAWQKLAFGVASLLLATLLLAQSAYWFRDEIANRAPNVAPWLATACDQLGCRLSPPRRTQALGFVGADLAADPAHKGLHVFTATLRNLSARAVAFPSLILTLDGVGGEPIARRVFSPEQYAPANANLARGLDGGVELEIKLYLDVSPATPVGFKADHAYF